MKTSIELREQRAKLVHDARAIHTVAQSQKRELSAEEKGQVEAMMAEVEALKQKIESFESAEKQVEELDAMAEEMERSQGRKAVADFRNDNRSGNPSHREHFRNYLRRGETRGLVADTNSSGGYFVAPLEFHAELIKTVDELCPISKLAQKKNIGKAQSIGTPTYTKMAAATWTTEVLIATADTTAASGRRDLTPSKLSKLIKVSNKLLRVGTINAEQVVLDDMARVFAETIENAYATGDGDGKPLGIFTADADGIPTSRDVSTGNTTTTITVDGLYNAFYSLKAGYRNSKNCAWVMNDAVIKYVRLLKDTTGQYIWQPSIKEHEPDVLIGKPVYSCSYAPSTFTAGLYLAVVGDFDFFWSVDRGEMEVTRLNELYAGTDEVGFIGRKDLDAAPVLGEAFARVKTAAS